MTNEELQSHISALREAARARRLEISYGHGEPFRTIHPDHFMPDRLTYRIKSKPREVWVHDDGSVRMNDPAESMGWSAPWKWHKFREVLND